MPNGLPHNQKGGKAPVASFLDGKSATAWWRSATDELKPMAGTHKSTAMEKNTKTQKRKDAAAESNASSAKEKTATLDDKWQTMIEKHTSAERRDKENAKNNQNGERT